MDFLSHSPRDFYEDEYVNEETLPNKHNRLDTLGFICIENVPDEYKNELLAEKLEIKNYHFRPRSYNIKPKQMSRLNLKADEFA
jgi:hypothetical protein